MLRVSGPESQKKGCGRYICFSVSERLGHNTMLCLSYWALALSSKAHTHVYMYMHTETPICTCMCTHSCIVCMGMRTHSKVHMYVCAHTQWRWMSNSSSSGLRCVKHSGNSISLGHVQELSSDRQSLILLHITAE